MTKIDIFSGFLGAGKTTLIKKLISEAYGSEKLVLIENEFGEIGVDSGFLEDAGINITEMNSGCICCSLVGDFGRALKEVIEKYSPDRIIIEPSGVGKLSDVINAVRNSEGDGAYLNCAVAVADAKKCRMYIKNFGEFYNNQIENASTVILSHTGGMAQDKLQAAVDLIRGINKKASVITTDWQELDGGEILSVMEKGDSFSEELLKAEEEEQHHHHHHDHDEECTCGEHHHHDHDEECTCGEHHHHDHDEECTCGEHHHHDHDEECGCGEHHHHDHDEECTCGEHHHHHHHADEVFTSWGTETVQVYTKERLEGILRELENEERYGMILRAKGIVRGEGSFIHFDYTPGESDIRDGSAATTGKLCVIGSKINAQALEELFLR